MHSYRYVHFSTGMMGCAHNRGSSKDCKWGPHLVPTVSDLYPWKAVVLRVSERHNECMNTVVIQCTTAIRGGNLEPGKHCSHFAIFCGIANPPT